MPVSFLSSEQRENYARYTGVPSPHDLARYFHLDDADHALIAQKRGRHSRLGFAVQLGTVRYLGTFLEDPLAVPLPVVHTLARQLCIDGLNGVRDYSTSRQRYLHAAEIPTHYGYVEITERMIGFRLTRWHYALCWTGTDRPSVLFERATAWLVTHKVLLPGATTLERYVARVRARVEERLWRLLSRGIDGAQQARLESLLVVPMGSRNSALDRLRTGSVSVSSPALVQALQRLRVVRELGIRLPATARISATRVAALARFAGAAKASAILRLPNPRRLATLVAFVHCLEASAQDDALEVLEALLRDLFNNAIKADRKARLRSLKDLDQAAAVLVNACQIVLDDALDDAELRGHVSTLVAYRLVASHRATPPFDEQGARLFGGRWNSKGRSAVYVAGSEALALLEVLVHIADSYQLNRYRLFQIDLPAAQVQRLGMEALPENWREDPPPSETAAIGDGWQSEADMLAPAIPSTIAVGDWNYLLNPGHDAFADAMGGARELELAIDRRLYKHLSPKL